MTEATRLSCTAVVGGVSAAGFSIYEVKRPDEVTRPSLVTVVIYPLRVEIIRHLGDRIQNVMGGRKR